MSFSRDTQKIRNLIKRYTKASVVQHLLTRLHTVYRGEFSVLGRPWTVCLMLEWTLELEPNQSAVPATEKDVWKILNKILALQGKATNFADEDNIWLSLRAFLLTQLRFQTNQIVHNYFLVRLFTIMCHESASRSFRDSFKAQTEIELEDFFVLSVFFFSIFYISKKPVIKYEEFLPKLSPGYPVTLIKQYLSLVGANFQQLQQLMKCRKFEIRGDGDVRAEEYFSEPLLLEKPILILAEGISTVHPYVASIGLSEFVLRTLKTADSEGFRDKFTKEFEDYLAYVFNVYGFEITREEQLKVIYKDNKIQGKVIDFLHQRNGTSVFIDAKGVEPNQKVLVTDQSHIIKDKLRDTHLKGIKQAGECAAKLSDVGFDKLAEFNDRYALIVTHQDFYLGNGVKLASYLGQEYRQRIDEAVAGRIPLKNIHFCCVADLEGILALCNETETEISDFLDFCAAEEEVPETAKFEMRQHIQVYAAKLSSDKSSPIGTDKLVKNHEYLTSELANKMLKSSQYWKEGLVKIPAFLQQIKIIKELV
ncbi:GapS1 family protein [Shewanella algae]|uniref:GapS1 family protein n=1 Tax=Shewanella algae TaxID=38313 RepID=UPI0031F5343B